MTNHRTTHRPGCRSDRAPYRCATGDLPALALTRGCAGIFGHITTLVNLPLSHLLTDLLQMSIGIQDRFGCRTTRHEKHDEKKTARPNHHSPHLTAINATGRASLIHRPALSSFLTNERIITGSAYATVLKASMRCNLFVATNSLAFR